MAYLGLRLTLLLRLRHRGNEDLWDEVLRDRTEYFREIGDCPAVARFRALLEARDLATLSREWPHLEKDFLAAEREAGRSGRPLMLEHFLHYRSYLQELVRRGASS